MLILLELNLLWLQLEDRNIVPVSCLKKDLKDIYKNDRLAWKIWKIAV